jgi:hypothetical protein
MSNAFGYSVDSSNTTFAALPLNCPLSCPCPGVTACPCCPTEVDIIDRIDTIGAIDIIDIIDIIDAFWAF